MSSLAAAVDRAALGAMLAELVGTPSVTPEEGRLADLVANRLDDLGAEVELVESLPGRHSVAARLGAGDEPGLLLNGHLDTVPAGDPGGWTHDPFGAELEDGLLFGRGSCDMKAGLAVMLELAAAIPRRRQRRRLVLHFAIGEERAEPGTRSLLERGHRAPVGIVVEPTLLRVATAGRGGGAIRIEVEGRAGHAGMPERAINPLSGLPAVLAALAAHQQELDGRDHPRLPAATATPTVVRGGETTNTIPARCELLVDRRLLPGERIDADAERLDRRLAALELGGLSARATAPANHWPPFETAEDGEFVASVREAAAAAGCQRAAETFGTPYATDAGWLAAAGVETVVFGPGDAAFAHRDDERVDLAEVERGAAALARVAERTLLEPP